MALGWASGPDEARCTALPLIVHTATDEHPALCTSVVQRVLVAHHLPSRHYWSIPRSIGAGWCDAGDDNVLHTAGEGSSRGP